MKKVLTLCIVRDDTQVLLGMKKRGFGEGRYNGFGGKVETGETVLTAAKRELLEEVGIVARGLTQMGVLLFTFADRADELTVHVFSTTDFEGVPVETEEMRPQWFSVQDIPFSQMWIDDELWFPYLLLGKKFIGSFHFDTVASPEYPGRILHHRLEEVASL